jgi:hypothetical protein
MAGLLSNEINNTEKISVFVGECKRGLSFPPDINRGPGYAGNCSGINDPGLQRLR